MTEISFTAGNWERYFQYAYTRRFPETPKFQQEANCIVNVRNGIRQNGCDFTSMLLKDTYGEGTTISFTASFESFGAPLLLIAEDLEEDEAGVLRFGTYQEIVLWEHGVNVWDFRMEKGNVVYDWVLRNEFPLEANKPHKLTVRLGKKRLLVWVNDRYFELFMPALTEKVWLGITACEGINRFYDLQVGSDK